MLQTLTTSWGESPPLSPAQHAAQEAEATREAGWVLAGPKQPNGGAVIPTGGRRRAKSSPKVAAASREPPIDQGAVASSPLGGGAAGRAADGMVPPAASSVSPGTQGLESAPIAPTVASSVSKGKARSSVASEATAAGTLVGRRIRKHFVGHGHHCGTVRSLASGSASLGAHHARWRLWTVEFEDGDVHDMDEDEVRKCLLPMPQDGGSAATGAAKAKVKSCPAGDETASPSTLKRRRSSPKRPSPEHKAARERARAIEAAAKAAKQEEAAAAAKKRREQRRAAQRCASDRCYACGAHRKQSQCAFVGPRKRLRLPPRQRKRRVASWRERNARRGVRRGHSRRLAR